MIIDNKIIWMLGNYPIRINNRKAYTFILEIFWKEESKTNINKDKIANTNATNPPTLLGIDRKIAYKCKKYHSG